MKRLISLLLIVITLSSLLAGCEWDGEFDWKKIFNWGESEPKWELPEGIIETTVEKDGSQLTIAHSENFTQDDIDFVVMEHGRTMDGYGGGSCTATTQYTLGKIIRNAQNNHPLFLVHIENPYIITAYIKPNQSQNVPDEKGNIYFDTTQYVWCKFYDGNNVPKTIGEVNNRSRSFLLYDFTLVKDIASGEEYNKQCKYYMSYSSYSSLDNTPKDQVMYFGSSNIGASDSKFIKAKEEKMTVYDVYTDENSIKYLVIFDEEYFIDEDKGYAYAPFLLEEYYDYLYPYFTRNESLDEKRKNYKGVYYVIYKKKQIELDLFIDLLFTNEEE